MLKEILRIIISWKNTYLWSDTRNELTSGVMIPARDKDQTANISILNIVFKILCFV